MNAIRGALLLVLLLSLLQGCGSDDKASITTKAASAKATWARTEPASYSFSFVGINPLGPLGGTDYVVQDGKVMKTVTTTGGPQLGPMTIDDVFARLDTALNHADEVTVTFDERFGFPVSITVDGDKDAIDDENSYQVSDFKVLQPRQPG